nr:S-layer homology domain-containing protein [Ammoniphilus resinae]
MSFSWISAIVITFACPFIAGASPALSDIQGHYAEPSIQKLYEAGIISGFPDDRFRPNDRVTRAEFLKLLLTTVQTESLIEGPIPFQQLEKHWAYPILVQSYQSGILLDTDWSLLDLGVDQVLTRGDASLLLANALQISGEDVEEPFKDLSSLPDKMRESILGLHEAGLIRGISETEFAPHLPLTRGQASILIDQALQFQEEDFRERMQLKVKVAKIKGGVQHLIDGVGHPLREGDHLHVGSEIQTGPEAGATLVTNDGDTLFIDENTRITIQELDTSLQLMKDDGVKAQSFKGDGILLRGKVGEENIGLNWETKQQAKSFSVFKAKNDSVQEESKPVLPSTSKTTWFDTEVSPGNSYSYQVTGKDANGNPLASQEVHFEVTKKASFKEWAGNVVVKVKSLFSSDSKFEIETPTTTAGVRGTLFMVSVQPNGRNGVSVFDGVVGVSRKGSSEAETLVHGNQQSIIPTSGQVQPPMTMDKNQFNPFIEESMAQLILVQQQLQREQEQRLQEMQAQLEKRLKEALASMPSEQRAAFERIVQQTRITEPPASQAEARRAAQERKVLDELAQHPNIQDRIKQSDNSMPTSPRSPGGDSSDDGSPSQNPQEPEKRELGEIISNKLEIQVNVVE